jgi:hypothetical protein
MSEMVDRVARTLFEENQFDNEAKYGSWDSAGEGAREEYRYMVRLAIRAMRKPTEAMIDAAYTGYDSEGFGIGRHDALTVWQAMIDAILSDDGVTTSDEAMR